MHMLARISFFILTVLLSEPTITEQDLVRSVAMVGLTVSDTQAARDFSTGGKQQQLNSPAAVPTGL